MAHPKTAFFLEHLRKFKVVNDPIHGPINLHPLVVKIIDTPQFQRLRQVHQLGGATYVYPGATHTRFEHSIGVSHLAGELIKSLAAKQPELKITEMDALCVIIAGLCHDLGHGPFSHVFDGKFMKVADPKKEWQHEAGSLKMLDYLIKSNDLKDTFKKYGLIDQDIEFIKALIHTTSPEDRAEKKTGRKEDKEFLYEIVANKQNGIDVDKWDYFSRDAHNTGVPHNMQLGRLVTFARVLEGKGQNGTEEKHIGFPNKEIGNLYDLFYTRSVLHRRVYQHKTTGAIELMITDALLEADEHIWLTSDNGDKIKMSEAVGDMSAFMTLNDHIFTQILYSTNDMLGPAKAVLHRIETRDLYRMIGDCKIPDSMTKDEMVEKAKKHFEEFDVEPQVVVLDYGAKDKNPILNVWFYNKDKPNYRDTEKHPVLNIMPAKFQDRNLRIYSKRTDGESLEKVKSRFDEWTKEMAKKEKTEDGRSGTTRKKSRV